MNRYLRTALALALFACVCLLISVPSSAQSVYGSIFGTVTDSTGAAIPNATVTVKDEAKGTVVTATSNGSGDYSVPHLIPDVYDLKVTAKGFKIFETKGLSVQADTSPRIDPALQIGAENTTVEVNADHRTRAKDGSRGRVDCLRSAASFEPSGRRSELHEPAALVARRATARLVSCGR